MITEDFSPFAIRRQVILVLVALLLVVGVGSLLAALLDDSGPTWVQQAQKPNCGRTDAEQLLQRVRWEYNRSNGKGE